MEVKSDIEIAQACAIKPIRDIAAVAGVDEEYLEYYGKYKAKIDLKLLDDRADRPDGKLILVTAINPTPAGEGKTTTTVGLADGMRRLGKNTVVALREPSLGPVFGVKGRGWRRLRLLSLWRTSTSTLPATSMLSAQPITFWPPCWTTTFSRAIFWTSTCGVSPGSAAWT